MSNEPKEEQEENKGKIFKLGPNLNCKKGKHYFEYVSGTEIGCTKCPIGYPIGSEIVLKKGNITIHGEELVI